MLSNKVIFHEQTVFWVTLLIQDSTIFLGFFFFFFLFILFFGWDLIFQKFVDDQFFWLASKSLFHYFFALLIIKTIKKDLIFLFYRVFLFITIFQHLVYFLFDSFVLFSFNFGNLILGSILSLFICFLLFGHLFSSLFRCFCSIFFRRYLSSVISSGILGTFILVGCCAFLKFTSLILSFLSLRNGLSGFFFFLIILRSF